jgi:hypothetical protein
MFCLDRIIMSLELGSRTDRWILWRFPPPRPSPPPTCFEIITCWVSFLQRAVVLDLPSSHQFSTDFHSRQTSGPWSQFSFSSSSQLSRRAKKEPTNSLDFLWWKTSAIKCFKPERISREGLTQQERLHRKRECVCAERDKRETKALGIAKREELKTAWSLSSSHKSTHDM